MINNKQYIKDLIHDNNILNFTLRALDEHSNEEKTNEAIKVCETMKSLFDFYKLDYISCPSTMYDTLFSAAMLHNMFFDSHEYLKEKDNKQNDWISLFTARYLLKDIEEKYLSAQEANAIFSCIEAQLGKETPVTMLIPNMGTPTDTFTLAIYISKEMNI